MFYEDLQKKIIDKIIEIEGGYVNDPSDSGGKTNWGITEKVARQNGYIGSMRHLPRELAFSIYVDKYWNSVSATEIAIESNAVAKEVVDTAINMGPKRASKFLQRSLAVLNNRGTLYPDIKVDGDVGPKTISALKSFLKHRGYQGERVLVSMLNALQGAHYVELAEVREKDEKFVYGWFLHRVSGV